MSNGATFEISFYYRDASSNIVTVAATTITNTRALFPTNTHFTDFQARVPQVKSGDAWAGKNIGIRLASTTSFALTGGYWDIDNVRLTESVLPNDSFESPRTDFASPAMDGWQKAPQPIWYSDTNFPWAQLTGQFLNPSNGAPDHIDNVDGRQAVFLFALPDVAIFQDYISVGGTNTTPTHDFNLRYEVGHSYSLTVGVLGGGGGMSNGATFATSFYYRDAASNKVTVASTSITNTKTLFPTNTHLTDFNVQLPAVKGSDAWADKQVGVHHDLRSHGRLLGRGQCAVAGRPRPGVKGSYVEHEPAVSVYAAKRAGPVRGSVHHKPRASHLELDQPGHNHELHRQRFGH
jgi:hypothetical protein